MKTVLLAGGTGLIGTRLTELLLDREYHVIILSRNQHLQHNKVFQQLLKTFPQQLESAFWDPDEHLIDEDAVKRSDVVINLSGANIAAKRWTDSRKKEIMGSRMAAGKTIYTALKNIPNKVTTVINASATGWYGEDKERPEDTPFKENLPASGDFIGKVCLQWENSIKPVEEELSKRLVIFRTGLVLSSQGGFFAEVIKSLNFRVATILGNGHHILSWIHIDDLCEMYLAAIEEENMQGVYNAVVPYSVTYKRFMKTVADMMYKGKYMNVVVPKVMLQLTFGDLSEELVKSCLVSAKRILDTGYSFQFPRLKEAVGDLLQK